MREEGEREREFTSLPAMGTRAAVWAVAGFRGGSDGGASLELMLGVCIYY